MTDQSPDLRGGTVAPHHQRSSKGRHAVPRTSALTRLRLPLGKALALTALPTVLVLASQRPPTVDTSATAAHSAPEEEFADGVDCARPDDTAAPSPTPSATVPGTPGAPTSEAPVEPRERGTVGEAAPAPTTTASPSTTASPTATAASNGLADLLGSLLPGATEEQSPQHGTTPTPIPTAPTPTPTTAKPSAAPPTTPHASPTPHTDVPRTPTPHHRTTEPPPRPAPTTAAPRTCDISDLKAPEDTSAGRFAAESWNLKGTRLGLHDLVFGGVVTVDTAAGPKRVLKFSAAAVTIRDLQMAVPVGPQIQHIDGAPGSTSTLRGDRITMYVESLTGTLSGIEGLPLPPALRLHLTPDTVPEWLYDTVGKLGLKLRIDLTDADIDQAGQTGGELVIPGIHGYGTPR
ncbi:hypothetical protein [Streptomyces griseorubiginosus]|uniref:hypothetical protein n=1 Tax=Streptomyces griseorubiginosus TaxID=67304 RepID=UPI002E80FEF2|nr:hypothetical protein [Streptomyces griseorubiginosus]WUB43748.1 hypothetical protein OHN19_10550 [Streptomyces griseorubiginosus]WUB52266.1 hypothetical protein OG942_10545 [Streptomyces griseorubiginosus]